MNRGRPHKSSDSTDKPKRGRPRKSIIYTEVDGSVSPTKRRSTASDSSNSGSKRYRYSVDPSEVRFSPTSLVKKLDGVDAEALGQGSAAASVELKDLGECIGSEEYERKREEVRRLAGDNFDITGKTALSLEGAAIAGAKLMIDENRATRSMCKKLKDECGIDEDAVLYRPLTGFGRETQIVQELTETRKASVMESLIDFRKQIQFKANVLQYVAEAEVKKGSKSDQRVMGKRKTTSDLPPPVTPQNKFVVNPLDGDRIIDNYALEVASAVRENRKPRNIAPIPFNIHLLDSDDDS